MTYLMRQSRNNLFFENFNSTKIYLSVILSCIVLLICFDYVMVYKCRNLYF